jgi:branched-chain amino acid transport system substrate-binding protein
MKTRRATASAAAFLLALTVVACGDDDDAADDTAAETAAAPTSAAAATTAATETTEAVAPTESAVTETTGGATTSAAPPSGEPVRIGVLTSLTGPFTPWGVQVRDGMQLAVDELNAAGGIDGRPVELSVVDDQSNPEEATSGLERLAEEGVVAIGGTISSDVGLATSRLAEELQLPLFLVKAGSEAILTQDSRYTFRTCLPAAPMVAGPIAQYAEQEGLTKVGAIVADYAWGQAIRGALETEFGALEGVELRVEVAPVPEQDFTTYLRNLETFAPDLLVATGHPPGSGPITVQSADLGLDIPVTGAYSPLAAVVSGAADAAIGRYSDFDCSDYQSDEYQELARRYLAMSDNTFMEDDAVAGYGIVQMVAQAVEEAGEDPVAIAEYLHGQTFDLPGYAFDVSWTEWGELAAAQPLFSVIGAGPAPEGVNEAGEWYPETLILPEPLEPYAP